MSVRSRARFPKSKSDTRRSSHGDLFTYVLVRALDEPQLYKGEDFEQSELRWG